MASRQHLRGLGSWIAVSATAFGACLIAFAFSRLYWLSVLLLIPAGFTMMIEMGSSNTLIQSMVPDRLRGRVMAVYAMMMLGMGPIGSLIAGAAAGRIGAPRTVAVGGLICMAAAGVFASFLPHIRVHARQLILEQQKEMAEG